MGTNSTPGEQDLLELVFPIMGVATNKKPATVCGTAFSLGGDMYLTAGHVWENAHTYPLQAMGVRHGPEQEMLLYRVFEAENIAAFDLAVLKTAAPTPNKALIWSTLEPGLFADVRAFGYPYGYDGELGTLNIRAFRGEIVGGTSLRTLTGQPPVYELSFPCPRGLSGAPLASWDSKPRGHVVGVVLTNTITEMTVFSETEILAEGGQITKLVKTEALHLGIAIRSGAVAGISSALLGCTIGERLQAHELLATGG
jgi:hypothetical protein